MCIARARFLTCCWVVWTIAAWVPGLTHSSAPRVRASSSTIRSISFAFRLSAGNLSCISGDRRRFRTGEFQDRKELVSPLGSGFLRAGARVQKAHSINCQRQNRHDPEQAFEPAQVMDDDLELPAEQISYRHDDRDRNDRAQQIISQKSQGGHPKGSGRQVDQGPESGQKACIEYRAMTVAAHESADSNDLRLGTGTIESEIAHQLGTETAAQKKQRVVAGHHAQQRYRQRDGKASDSAMDQESTGQQGDVLRHRQSHATQQQDREQPQVREMFDVTGDEAYQASVSTRISGPD